jgi:glycosyltransferase involved in cell wall biosynthesis
MTLPSVSIITPSYRQAQYIEATIQSVLAQNYPRLEYLVIDGGSADGTLDILPRYHKFLRWWSEPDSGQAQAINKGFHRATGEIIAWLNSDDIYLPGTLHRVARFFQQHPAIDVVYGDYYLIDPAGRVVLRKKEIPFDYHILLYGLDYLSQPTVFFRRSLLTQFGFLDESLHYGLDWEYWLRLARGGARFAHLPCYLPPPAFTPPPKPLSPPRLCWPSTGPSARDIGRPLVSAPRRRKVGTPWPGKSLSGQAPAQETAPPPYPRFSPGQLGHV